MKRNTKIIIFIDKFSLLFFSALLFSVFYSVNLYGQGSEDKSRIKNTPQKIEEYLEKAAVLAHVGDDSARYYLNAVKTLNTPIEDSAAYKESEFILAILCLRNHKIDSAKTLFERACKPLADSSNMRTVLRAMNGLANIYFTQGDYATSLKLVHEAEMHAISLGLKDMEGRVINNLGIIYKTMGDYERAFGYFLRSAIYNSNNGDTVNLITNLNNIGIYYRETGQADKSMEYHRKALKLSEETGDIMLKAITYEHLAELHIFNAYFDSASVYLKGALKIFKDRDLPNRVASVYLHMGEMAAKQGAHQKAYDYFSSAEQTLAGYTVSDLFSKVLLNKGKAATDLGKFAEAERYLQQVELLASQQGQMAILTDCYLAFSELSNKSGDYRRAYLYHKKYQEQKDKQFNQELSNTIAKEEAVYQVKTKNKDLELLKQKQQMQMLHAQHQQKQLRLSRIYMIILLVVLLLSVAAGVMAFHLAVKNKRSNDHLKLKNRIIQEKNNEITQQNEEIRAQTEQLFHANKELRRFEAALKNTNNAVVIMDGYGEFLWVNKGFTKLYGMTKEEFKKQNLNIFDAANSSDKPAEIKQKVLNCIENRTTEKYEFTTFGTKGEKIWVQTTITPIINEEGEVENLIAIDSDITEIKKYETKLLATTQKVLEQKNELQKQNIEINSAIRYAGTIQKAILPEPDYIHRDIDFYLIYKPKQIVSGDFYWFANPMDLPYIFVAITDCTGHGVPGAFMSMIGTRLLNSIVNEKAIYDPAEILEMMHENVKETLKQHTTGNMDGMDISLCRIEPVSQNQKRITFCGAKQSIFYHRKNSGEIKKVRGDIKTIGGLYYDQIRFTNKVLSLYNGDMLYLTSDGLIDQNAPNRKKFGTLNLMNLLKGIAELPLTEQKEKMLAAYENHRQNQSQRDDISFLGIRL